MRWPKYWSFSFSISPPKEYSGLVAFRTDFMCTNLFSPFDHFMKKVPITISVLQMTKLGHKEVNLLV